MGGGGKGGTRSAGGQVRSGGAWPPQSLGERWAGRWGVGERAGRELVPQFHSPRCVRRRQVPGRCLPRLQAAWAGAAADKSMKLGCST